MHRLTFLKVRCEVQKYVNSHSADSGSREVSVVRGPLPFAPFSVSRKLCVFVCVSVVQCVCCPQSWSLGRTDNGASPQTHFLAPVWATWTRFMKQTDSAVLCLCVCV